MAIGMAWAVYFAQMPVIKANVGASDAAYGIALLIAAFGALAAMWLAPAARAALGSMAMPISIAALACGMMAAGLSGGLLALTLAMLLTSAASGVIDVLVNARVSEIEASSGRTLMNLNHALYSFAYAGGALATSALRSADVPPLPIFACLAVVLAFLAISARDKVAPLEDAPTTENVGMPIGLVMLGGLTVLVAFTAEAVSEGWSALHIERTLEGAPWQGALGPAVVGLSMGIGRLFGHGLVRLMRDTTLMLIATLFAAAGLMITAFAQSAPMGLVGFAIVGLGISVVAPLALALVGRRVPPEARLAAISRVSVIGYGAFFFGPPAMGLMAEGFGLRTAFMTVSAVLALTALVLIPALVRTNRR